MRDGTLVGLVALIDREHRHWKAYIGVLSWPSDNPQEDALSIVRHAGVHAGEAIARALMPPELVDGLELRAS